MADIPPSLISAAIPEYVRVSFGASLRIIVKNSEKTYLWYFR